MKLQVFVAIVFIINQPSCVFPVKPEEDDFVTQIMAEAAEQCEKVGGNEARKEIQNSFGEFKNCSFADLFQDYLVASLTGNFKPLITKSCNKVPEIKKCKRPLMSAMQKCFSQQKRQDLEIINALVDEALDYVCFNGGERITSFLATGGLECLSSNDDDKFLECDNSPESQSMVTNIFLDESISFFNEKSCKESEVSFKCVLGLLKTCPDPTPANLIDGLYNATEKKTPCNPQFRNGANHPESSIILFGTIIVWKIITLFDF